MIKNKKTLAVSSLILSALFFGGTFIVVKNLLDNFSPINIVFLRYAIASLLFLLTGGIPTKKTIKPGISMGHVLQMSKRQFRQMASVCHSERFACQVKCRTCINLVSR